MRRIFIFLALSLFVTADLASAQTLDKFRDRLNFGVPSFEYVVKARSISTDSLATLKIEAQAPLDGEGFEQIESEAVYADENLIDLSSEQLAALSTLEEVQELRELAQLEDISAFTQMDEEGEVSVNESDEARLALVAMEELSKSRKNTRAAYRIDIFFSNRANARNEARDILRKADSLYSRYVHTMSYQNPYFKVSTGPFSTQEEAIMALNKLSGDFPKAFLVRDELSPSDLINVERKENAMQYAKELLARGIEGEY